jgi:class 3 adenylate cyclase
VTLPPSHPVLAAVARQLDRHRMAAAMADHEMRVVWFSSEWERAFGADEDRWLGLHYAEWALSKGNVSRFSERSVLRAGLDLLPMLIDRTPGGREAMREILTRMLGADAATVVDQVPDRQDPIWTMSIKWSPVQGMAQVNTSGLVVEIHDREGAFVGAASIFFAPLPFRLVALLARGDEESLERMARLTNPGRHAAAILFADLQASGTLSRRLPSAVYFRMIRSLITAIDEVIISHQGIPGRHAGDGATAFFLPEDLGSQSLAARAAIEAGREIRIAAGSAVGEVEQETEGLVDAKSCQVNVGLHWGGSLYMGQLVTGGRLEVTALGDAVNECARIQETARDGQILASKALLENIDGAAAAALGLDPDVLSYAAIAEIGVASEKAIRDAGGIAVAAV